jgi:hypothetical protein
MAGTSIFAGAKSARSPGEPRRVRAGVRLRVRAGYRFFTAMGDEAIKSLRIVAAFV